MKPNPALIAIAVFSLCGCATKPTVAIAMSRFHPYSAMASQAEMAAATASFAAEMKDRGFVIVKDARSADYTLFGRLTANPESPAGTRAVVVTLKANPKPALPPETGNRSTLGDLSADAWSVQREILRLSDSGPISP